VRPRAAYDGTATVPSCHWSYRGEVPLVAAAVCPHPPALVPELAGVAARELDPLRAACADAVGRVLAARPDRVLVVGAGPALRGYPPDAHGSLRPYGLDRRFAFGEPVSGDGPELPLSLLVGAWLRHRLDPDGRWWGQGVPDGLAPTDCLRLGAELAAGGDRLGLVVMGDGSACRGEKAPGYDDPRALPYDEAVAAALAAADTTALRDLDPVLSAELLVAGRPAWQVLAGAVEATGGTWQGELGYHEAPYGVAYLVATWLPAGAR
jgi:hypothetical protein